MRLFQKLLSNTFSEQASFRFNYLCGLFFSFAYLFLQVSVWRGLYGTSLVSVKGIGLRQMIAYTVIANLLSTFTGGNLMNEMNRSIIEGDIVSQLLMPVGYRKYLFIQALASDSFRTLYTALPRFIVALLVFQVDLSFGWIHYLLFVPALLFAYAIKWLYSFLMGLLALWFRNAFFIDNANAVFFLLFTGEAVPLWFFPGWLEHISLFLPFRYIIFEPAAIVMGTKPPFAALRGIGVQAAWVLGLFVLGSFVWSLGKRRLFIQGG